MVAIAAGLALTSYPLYGQGIVINEIMAINARTLADSAGEYDDWFELYNPTGRAIDIGGLYLTDDLHNPIQWQIPTGRSQLTTIAPGGYLLIWADQAATGSDLHANFQLEPAGEAIGLFDRDGTTLIDSVVFPRQRPDISYGRDPDGPDQWRYLSTPTPGKRNAGALLGVVADVAISHYRGFYDEPFALELTTDTPGAMILYTLDGSAPCTPVGGFASAVKIYSGQIPITTTTCVRVAAYQIGWLATPVETHTYIFLDDVRRQATDPVSGAQITPPGCPTSWGSVNGDYQVDPDVVGANGRDKFGGLYATTIKDDLKSVPTISLVMDIDNWFGPTGIYINKSQDGTERACSLEWIDPNGETGFQLNCAMAMQGGVSGGGTSLDRWKVFKLSMRPRFKTTLDNGQPTYGPAQLDYRLIPDSPINRFDTIVLDAVLNNAWNHSGQHVYPTYIQDQYVSDLHNAMGGQSPHGLYAHVYINGLYWGMYYVHERPDHAWAAQMFGGEKEEYDALKHYTSMVVNNGLGGSATANFNTMISAANAVAADPTNAAKYDALCRMLDVDNFITDLLAHWFAVSWDWPGKNWYATHRNSPDGRWRFHTWDAEHSLEYWTAQNVLGMSVSGIHDKLKGNAEYRIHFADLVHRHFFNGGALSYPNTETLYQARMAQIDRAIVGESARWGDARSSMPHTRQDWVVIQDNILTQFIQPRSDFVLNWLKGAGLYPSVGAPVFNINGSYRHGGHIASTDSLSMSLPQGGTGKTYYSLDGSDPRQPAAVVPAQAGTSLVVAGAPKRVLVPTVPIGDGWRGGGTFDDSAWTSVTGSPGGVGFDTNPASGGDYRPYISHNVETQMYGAGKNTTCYIRIPFTVSVTDLVSFNSLALKMQYDDGFVAYLNGFEVARAGLTGAPAWNSRASTSRDAGTAFTSFDISGYIVALRPGDNILAIHGLNNSPTSSDFLMLVELAAGKTSGPVEVGVSPAADEYKGPITLGKSARVKARAKSGDTWSALNEAVYAVGLVAESLRITEIMYHPKDTGNPSDPNTEFIELTNIGAQTINLNLVQFTKGVDFTFGDMALQPNKYILVVKDLNAFTARYGQGLPIAGTYTGSLDNAGERIRLEDAVGQVILDFEYKDGWYKSTDGQGYSLVLREPRAAGPNTMTDKDLWRASLEVWGSPGRDDTGK